MGGSHTEGYVGSERKGGVKEVLRQSYRSFFIMSLGHMLITSTLLLMVLVIVPAVPPLASSLLDACGHRSFLFILDMSQHPSTL